MKIDDSLIRDFVSVVNRGREKKPTGQNVYGTVKIVNGQAYVVLDGSDVQTPINSTVEVGNNDRVLVNINDHKATVLGNLSYPAITRVGEYYVTLTANGLIVGRIDSGTGSPIGPYVLIRDSGFDVYNSDHILMATFGPNSQVGLSSGKHLSIDSSGIKIYSGSTLLATISDTIRIGKTGKPNMLIDQDSMVMTDKDGNEFVKIEYDEDEEASYLNVGGDIRAKSNISCTSEQNSDGFATVRATYDDGAVSSSPRPSASLYADAYMRGFFIDGSPVLYKVPGNNALKGYCTIETFISLSDATNVASVHGKVFKYLDGRMTIIMRVKVTSVACTTKQGEIYTGNITGLGKWPVPFYYGPIVNVSARHTNVVWGILGVGTVSATNLPNVRAFRGVSSTLTNEQIDIVAEGIWSVPGNNLIF